MMVIQALVNIKSRLFYQINHLNLKRESCGIIQTIYQVQANMLAMSLNRSTIHKQSETSWGSGHVRAIRNLGRPTTTLPGWPLRNRSPTAKEAQPTNSTKLHASLTLLNRCHLNSVLDLHLTTLLTKINARILINIHLVKNHAANNLWIWLMVVF